MPAVRKHIPALFRFHFYNFHLIRERRIRPTNSVKALKALKAKALKAKLTKN